MVQPWRICSNKSYGETWTPILGIIHTLCCVSRTRQQFAPPERSCPGKPSWFLFRLRFLPYILTILSPVKHSGGKELFLKKWEKFAQNHSWRPASEPEVEPQASCPLRGYTALTLFLIHSWLQPSYYPAPRLVWRPSGARMSPWSLLHITVP